MAVATKQKLVVEKERWAREGRLLTGRVANRATDRMPPGQRLVNHWPVLDLGRQPLLDRRDWSLTVGGQVERRLNWGWADLARQRMVRMASDIHCVTGWSTYDNRWTGVSTRQIMDLVRPTERARFVILKSFDGYGTYVTIEDFFQPDALLATHWNGVPLTREHGAPVRLVMPHLYFWKSAKWLRHIWFTDQPAPGYWEARGYHYRGDPWREERYGRSKP